MLCTVISDAYATDEREAVYEALEDLLAPRSPDWSRKGVYAYWDRESHDLLYVGLASNLPLRYAQHNGLVSHAGGNKRDEIDAHFEQHEYLGITFVIQAAAVALEEAFAELSPLMGVPAGELIRVGEGQLIEMHRIVKGDWPPWNHVGGAKLGGKWATPAEDLLDVIAHKRDSLFIARRSLRNLTDDPAARQYEAAIHAGRMRAVMEGHGVEMLPTPDLELGEEEAVERLTRAMMLKNGHLLDELNATDEQIVHWVRQSGQPEFWNEEAGQARALFESFRGEKMSSGDRKLMAFLDSLLQQAAPPEHVQAVEDLLATGYLDDAPVIPGCDQEVD